MKRIISLLLAVMIAFGCLSITASAAPTPINVTFRGTTVEFPDAQPFVDANGRTMVPLRPIGEAMGLSVSWEADTRSALFTYTRYLDVGHEYYACLFTIGSEYLNSACTYFDENYVNVDGHPLLMCRMDTAPVIRDGRTYAPVRYLAEAFGYSVSWDAATKTVQITGTGCYED